VKIARSAGSTTSTVTPGAGFGADARAGRTARDGADAVAVDADRADDMRDGVTRRSKFLWWVEPGRRAAGARRDALKIDGRRYDGAFVRLQRARAIHAMHTTVTSGRVSTSSSPYRLVPAGTGLLRRNRPTLGTR
jgi:hypothetical protein